MSSEALTWAKGQAAGSSSLKGLLLLLGDVANEHGVLWAGVDYLAEIMECNRTTMMQNLRKLQDAGVIHRIERRKPNGARHGTITVLGPSSGPTRSPMKAAENHPMYGSVIAESLSRESPPREFPRGISGAPRSENPTRTNIEPTATDVAAVKEATDEFPADLPEGLVPVALEAGKLLKRTALVRGQRKQVTRAAVGHAVLTYPDRDHVKVARDVEYWLLHGRGARKPCGDIVQRYRNFLDGADPMPGPGTAPPSAARRTPTQDERMQIRAARLAALEDQPHEGDSNDTHRFPDLGPGLVLVSGQR